MIQFLKLLFEKTLNWLGFVIGPKRQNENCQFHLIYVDSRPSAKDALRDPLAVVVLGNAAQKKWVQMNCPCGCGEILSLNLMPSHTPLWQISVADQRRFTIHPSVDSVKCGAHFWVREGRLKWV